MADPYRDIKDRLLSRLNREYRYESNTLIRTVSITKEQSNSSFKSLEDTRNEYIDRLKRRIQQLEDSTGNSKLSSDESQRGLKSRQTPRLKRALAERQSINEVQNGQIPIPRQDQTPLARIKQQHERDEPEIEHDPQMKLVTCDTCNRKFRSERISIHKQVCEKGTKRRTTFDQAKQRIKGTDLESYTPKASSKVKISLKNPFAPAKDPQGTACLYCNRFFNEISLEKHQPICKAITSKPKRQVFLK